WRLVTKGGMQSFRVVVAVDELLDVNVQILKVAVFVGVDFLPLERLDEALATRVVVGVRRTTHALNHTVALENRDVFRRSILHSAVGVLHYSRQGRRRSIALSRASAASREVSERSSFQPTTLRE